MNTSHETQSFSAPPNTSQSSDKTFATGHWPLANEKDLETYQSLAIERPITNITSHLQQIEKARRAFNLGEGIVFENHANTLSDSNDEVQQSLQNLRVSDKGQASSSNPKPKDADKFAYTRRQVAREALV
jgi:hypothetical protein